MKTMNTMQTVLVAALAVAAFSNSDAALAQRAGGLGARVAGRAASAQPAPAPQAAPQAPAPQTPSLGTTRPIAQPASRPAAQAPASQAASKTAAPQAAQTAQPPAKEPLKKSDGSEFVVPAGATVDQLIAQANELLETEVAFETEEEYNDWIGKMLETIGKIGERILASKPTDEQFVQGISLRGQALCYQASIDPKALPKLGNYATALEKNERVQKLEDGRQAATAFKGVYLQAKVADIAEQNGTPAELAAAMKEVGAFIAAHPEASDMTVDLVFPVKLVAENQKQPTLPSQVWTPIRKQLAASDAPEAKNALVLLEGAIRYSQLEGRPIEWKGCDKTGEPLDTKKVEGKVVLVTFWASWLNGLAEFDAQLKELYEKYRDSGFEIVGYNLDSEQADADKYVKNNAIPWIILSDRAAADTKQTSLATYYGISEIPTMILVGGDGNVAAVDIGMESLIATLESVFAQSQTQAAKASAGAAATPRPAASASAKAPASVSPASKSSAKTTIKSTSPSRANNK